MIDFTNCSINKFKAYGGGNGAKINITYENKSYMLKFAPRPKQANEISYTNSCFSEYIACHIYQSLDIKTQNTLLGIYQKGMKKVAVVACEDFNTGGYQLMEFANLKNTCIDSSQNGYGIELASVMEAIQEQTLIDPQQLKDHFWDMFIADALLGNFDRHNGNWGLLVNENTQDVKIAPVYDCGSCLYPQLSEKDLQKVLADPNEIIQRVFVFPNSAIKINNKKLNYFDYISSLSNPDCTKALLRIAPRIDLSKVAQIIDDTPLITDMQKKFYKVILSARKERIIDFSKQKFLEKKKEFNKNKSQHSNDYSR